MLPARLEHVLSLYETWALANWAKEEMLTWDSLQTITYH